MALIELAKPRKSFDPHIAPMQGRRGPCALCGHCSQLTESHILPKAAGNTRDLLAHSYLSSSAGGEKEYLARRFKHGISFWTLCQDCNTSLGGDEDREIAYLYDRVSSDLNRGIILPSPLRYTVRPNKLIRGILAHMASANDPGARTLFDREVQQIFRGEKSLRETRLRVYYWPYVGDRQVVIRDVSVTQYFFKDLIWMQVLKMKPLGFAATNEHVLHGLPCLNVYMTDRDDEEREIPLLLEQQEYHPHWPASPSSYGAAFLSSHCLGLVARPR